MKLPGADVIKRRMLLAAELDELFLTHRRRLAALHAAGRFPYRMEIDPRSDIEYWRRLANSRIEPGTPAPSKDRDPAG